MVAVFGRGFCALGLSLNKKAIISKGERHQVLFTSLLVKTGKTKLLWLPKRTCNLNFAQADNAWEDTWIQIHTYLLSSLQHCVDMLLFLVFKQCPAWSYNFILELKHIKHLSVIISKFLYSLLSSSHSDITECNWWIMETISVMYQNLQHSNFIF